MRVDGESGEAVDTQGVHERASKRQPAMAELLRFARKSGGGDAGNERHCCRHWEQRTHCEVGWRLRHDALRATHQRTQDRWHRRICANANACSACR